MLPFEFNNGPNWNSRDNVHLIIVGGVRYDNNVGISIGMGFLGTLAGGVAMLQLA